MYYTIILLIVVILLIVSIYITSSKYHILQQPTQIFDMYKDNVPNVGIGYFAHIPIQNKIHNVFLDTGSYYFVLRNIDTTKLINDNKTKFIKYSPSLSQTLNSQQCRYLQENKLKLTIQQKQLYELCGQTNLYTINNIFGNQNTQIYVIDYGGIPEVLGLAQILYNDRNLFGSIDLQNVYNNFTINFPKLKFILNDDDVHNYKYVTRKQLITNGSVVYNQFCVSPISLNILNSKMKNISEIPIDGFVVIFDTGTYKSSISELVYNMMTKDDILQIKLENNVVFNIHKDENIITLPYIIIGNDYLKNFKVIHTKSHIGFKLV